MAKCATCNKTIAFGGIKDGDARYCSPGCRFQEFFPRLESALARVAAANPVPPPEPRPKPAPGPSSQGADWEHAEFATFGEGGKDLAVILLGWAGSVAVAALVYWLVNLVGYPFHAQFFWFVIPVGPYLCGMAAGVGFWLALRWLNRLPTMLTYLAAAVGGASSYVLMYALMWWLLEFQGVRARDQVGFLEFLQYVIEHQRIRFARGGGGGAGVEVGQWGYARFGLSVLGFALGVVSMVAFGGGKGYCPRCNRYVKAVGTQVRSSSDPEAIATALHPTIVGLVTGRVQEALDHHARLGVPGNKEYFITAIAVEGCPG